MFSCRFIMKSSRMHCRMRIALIFFIKLHLNPLGILSKCANMGTGASNRQWCQSTVAKQTWPTLTFLTLPREYRMRWGVQISTTANSIDAIQRMFSESGVILFSHASGGEFHLESSWIQTSACSFRSTGYLFVSYYWMGVDILTIFYLFFSSK